MLYALRSLLCAFYLVPQALCIALFALCSMLFYASYVSAEGLSGWGNLNYTTTEQSEDGERISTEDAFFRNLFLTFERPITPIISYQLYFRTNWSDFSFTDSEGNTTDTYQRSIEPAADFFLRNPLYDFSAGYRRLENWSTAHLSNEGQRTTEFIYSRLNFTPRDFPFFSLQFDRQKEFDHLSPKGIDNSDMRYTGISWYQLSYKDLNLSYNVTYSHNINREPVGTIQKTKSDNFTGLYNLHYSKSFWGGKTTVSADYQGNYIRNKNQFFVSQTGSVLSERTPFGGLHAQGTAVQPSVDVLSSQSSLVDDNFNTGIAGINIGTQSFHNIGIWVPSERSVDRLYVYVNQDVSSDTNLTSPSNWRIYRSDANIPGAVWTPITILSVAVVPFDAPNDIYRYEIRFSAAQNASFFKAVNMNTVNAPGITNVLVTEIEAYGTDVVPETGELTDVSNFFTQGINLITTVRPITKLNITLNYFITRSDQHPKSVWDSIGGIFTNIFRKSIDGSEDKLRSNVTRTYGATSTWLTHRLLTTTVRLQRNETFDNRDEIDVSTNTYALTFTSSPLPTLETNLSYIRSDTFNFSERQTTNDSVLLSAVSKLYRDVNMVTDLEYTQSKSHTTDIRTTTTSARGTLDALLTRKLHGNFIYGLTWTSSAGTSSSTKEGITLLTYRPGRFISFTGTFRVSDTDSDTTISEGILIDWLPLPAIRLNLNYLHTSSDPGPSTIDSFIGYGIWYITKFIDFQLTYGYMRDKQETETTSYNIGANLNVRF